MLSNKEWKLLQELYEHQSIYQTSRELAEKLALSDRTVRKYLNQMTQEIQDHGAVIEMKYGHGYKLIIENHSIFLEMFEQLHISKEELIDVQVLEENTDREHYLLQQLFFKEIEIDTKSVMSELHISRTTVSTILARIRQRLKPYDLELRKTARGTYQVDGREQYKRRFIVDYFLTSNFKHPLLTNIKSQSFLSDLDLSQIAHLILEACKEGQLLISDYVLTNLLIHIALTIHRIRIGHMIADYPIEQTEQMQLAYRVAERIIQDLTQILKLEFPKGETSNIALHLLTKAKSQHQLEQVLPRESEEELSEILGVLDSEMGSHFKDDQGLTNSLLTHLNPMLLRLKYHIRMENPLREEIMESYPEFFELTKRHFQNWIYLKEFQVSDDEWAYLALHLIAAFERENTVEVVNVLVVCATGFGSAQVLKNRIQNQFSNRLNILACISYHELSDASLAGVDLIISSIDLGEILFQVPTVMVSVFLNKADIDTINQSLQMLSHRGHVISNQFDSDTDWVDSFETCFSPDKFLLIEGPVTKKAVLEQMISCLDEVQNPDFAKEFYRAIEERETLSSTAFSDLMAFPHLVTSLGIKEEIVIAILGEGVEWDTSHPNVRILCLLSPSRFENPHLKIMTSQLAQLANQIELQEELLSQPTFHHFRKILKTI
ncbi:BglG family transcription antiterminator [Streptococcus sp. 20-1249]|uniref:BglG family transcription antiterminator n=1 Tax=Streptococcus hepaticus TaxID=3349163 RepID=UPI00374A754A